MTRAIVIGGSVGGLCAARALCEHFDDVIVLERDNASSAPAARTRHAHWLLDRGRIELEALFPGFGAALRAAGAQSFDPGLEMAVHRKQGWQVRGENGTEMLWSSRALLEDTLRRLLREQSAVQLRDGCRVTGLRCAPGKEPRAAGVRLLDRARGAGELEAELVVDASGRHSRIDDWLRELRLTAPRRDCVDAHAGYASRLYRAPGARPDALWWKALCVQWQPPDLPRGGMILPIEGDRWLVTLAGLHEQRPPTDETGFADFMRSLGAPDLADAAASAEPISEITSHRSLSNVFRRYDRWSARLPGFIAIADAVCALNPVYGYGITAAAVCAGLLKQQLADCGSAREEFEPQFFTRQAAFLKTVWELATSADFAWPSTDGERSWAPPLVHQYVKLVLAAAHRDPSLRRHVSPVLSLTAPPSRLFEAKFMARVLLAAGRGQPGLRLLGKDAPSAHAPQ